jgi:hypothetical protein
MIRAPLRIVGKTGRTELRLEPVQDWARPRVLPLDYLNEFLTTTFRRDEGGEGGTTASKDRLRLWTRFDIEGLLEIPHRMGKKDQRMTGPLQKTIPFGLTMCFIDK